MKPTTHFHFQAGWVEIIEAEYTTFDFDGRAPVMNALALRFWSESSAKEYTMYYTDGLSESCKRRNRTTNCDLFLTGMAFAGLPTQLYCMRGLRVYLQPVELEISTIARLTAGNITLMLPIRHPSPALETI